MKYFLDQEFIERFTKPFLGKPRHCIDLISIGIVAEDGREYSAISDEYDPHKASEWVIDNVIKPLYSKTVPGNQREHYTIWDFHRHFGKSNKVIAGEIYEFVNPQLAAIREHKSDYSEIPSFRVLHDQVYMPPVGWVSRPKFYGYFADYDWVLFCSLFGKMIDLPGGFPMYCRDVKQMLDEKVEKWWLLKGCSTFDQALAEFKSYADFPKNTAEHDAIADARWNKLLHDYLLKF